MPEYIFTFQDLAPTIPIKRFLVATLDVPLVLQIDLVDDGQTDHVTHNVLKEEKDILHETCLAEVSKWEDEYKAYSELYVTGAQLLISLELKVKYVERVKKAIEVFFTS